MTQRPARDRETPTPSSADTELPALDELSGVDTVQRGDVHELEATYFDTADLALAKAGISLRRRTGGADAGWHLKLPMKEGRFEVHEPLSRATKTVPEVAAHAAPRAHP